MPVTYEQLTKEPDAMPMREVYARAGVTADDVARVRKEALEAKTEKLLKVKGGISPALLPHNVSIISLGYEETILLHTTVDHRTRLEAAEAVAQEMGLKPAKRVDVNMTASRLLADVLTEIDGSSVGIPISDQAAEENGLSAAS